MKTIVKWKTIGKILTKTKTKKTNRYILWYYVCSVHVCYIYQKGSQVLKDTAKRKIEISNAEEKNQTYTYTITWNTRISRIMWLVSYQLYRSHKQQQQLLQNTQIYCYSIALCMIGQILSTTWLKIVNNSKIITKNKRKYFVCIFFCVYFIHNEARGDIIVWWNTINTRKKKWNTKIDAEKKN